jgi:hypothetical protein
MIRFSRPAVALGFLLGWATTAHGQSWREVRSSRFVQAEQQLSVEVVFTSGTFRLLPGSPERLYHVEAMYDEDHFESATRFDTDARRLKVEVTPDDLRDGVELDDESPQYLNVALSPEVPVALDLKLGAAQSEISLGGLAVERLAVKTGASTSIVQFDRPNRIRCEKLEIAVGAAEFVAEGLGNAHCNTVELTGGAGDVTLDFSGAWTDAAVLQAELTMGLGVLTLRIPDDVGVELEMSRLFASVDRARFVKRGSHWFSSNYDSARATLRLHVRAVLGEVNFDWVTPTTVER